MITWLPLTICIGEVITRVMSSVSVRQVVFQNSAPKNGETAISDLFEIIPNQKASLSERPPTVILLSNDVW